MIDDSQLPANSSRRLLACFVAKHGRKEITPMKSVSVVLLIAGAICQGDPPASRASYIGPFESIKAKASTVPENGDVNPYGVTVIPASVGLLEQGNVLVSNFNNGANLQGTGTTIVQVSAGAAKAKLFAQIDPNHLPSPCPGGIGLTTALVALRSGWVIVGSLPTSDGTAATAQAGCLLVLNSSGQVVETISGPEINGPWDMTALDMGNTASLFVTNVLFGTVDAGGGTVAGGTVLRIDLWIPSATTSPVVKAMTRIGSGFAERTDPAALVIGPTGVGLGADGTLYVADTLNNRIASIADAAMTTADAGTGTTVAAGGALNGPLGLTIAPNGNILTTNGGDGNMVETTPGGSQIAVKPVDITNTGAGTLFGLAITSGRNGVYFVNDGNNTLDWLRR
jgi:hypothetical protein